MKILVFLRLFAFHRRGGYPFRVAARLALKAFRPDWETFPAQSKFKELP